MNDVLNPIEESDKIVGILPSNIPKYNHTNDSVESQKFKNTEQKQSYTLIGMVPSNIDNRNMDYESIKHVLTEKT